MAVATTLVTTKRRTPSARRVGEVEGVLELAVKMPVGREDLVECDCELGKVAVIDPSVVQLGRQLTE